MVSSKSIIFAGLACTAAVEAGGVFKAILGRDVEMRGAGDVFARVDDPAKAPGKNDIHAQIAAGFKGCQDAIAQLERDHKPKPKVVKSGQDAVITEFPPICADEANELKPKDPTFIVEASRTEIKLHNAPQSLLDKL